MRLPYNRGGLRSYLMVIGLLACQVTPSSIALGIPFLLAGIALRLWAKGCLRLDLDSEVTTSGPYSVVRHPFYVANAFLDLGIAIMSGWWLLPLLLPIWWFSVYIPVMRREEAKLIGMFGDMYRAYRERVPMLLPYRRPLARLSQGFSWHNPNLSKTEVPRAFRALSVPLMFVIAYRIRSQGVAMFFSPTLFDVSVVVLCVALFAVAGAWRQHFKHRKSVLPS